MKTAAAFAILIVLAAAPPLSVAQVRAELASLREQALGRYRSGRYNEAAELYRKLSLMEPHNVGYLKDLMWALWQAERYQQAADVANRIKKLRPEDTEAATILGRAPKRLSQEKFDALRQEAITQYRAGRYEEAVDRYKKLSVLEPKNPHVLKDLMWALWQAGQRDEAGEVASQVTTLRPEDTEGWNLYAESLAARGQNDLAIEVYRNSLRINPAQLKALLAAARLEAAMRNYEDAITFLEQARANHPGYRDIYPLLARIQFYGGRYADSAKSWEKAIQEFPGETAYRYQEAQALYFSGQRSAALVKMKHLAAEAQYPPAVHFVNDDALASGDKTAAKSLLEDSVTWWLPGEEALWLKLASLYDATGDSQGCLSTLKQFRRVHPKNQQGLLLEAQCLKKAGRLEDAIRAYEDVLRLNPSIFQAYSAIADAYSQLKQPEKALEVLLKARKMDPTNPYLLLRHARYLYDAGDRPQSRQMLVDWLKKNQTPALPVLLYHGLTPLERDPLLAYSVHMKVAVFKDHMRAIKRAGFTPVTAAGVNRWYHEDGKLPPRPILITFDDGRMDSFRYADPILKEINLKATMFACLVNVEADLPGYASWPLLERYGANGRWEIESHGDQSHGRIPISAEGRKGLFLTHRQWLAAENRLETPEEFKARIAKDHETAKKKFMERLGKKPEAFAFPEGEYGQNTIPNIPQAAEVNLDLARQAFGTSYHQDVYGFNVRSRDPARLTRLEPDASWTGEQLVRFLKDQNPFTLFTRELFKQAAWKGDTHEAAYWLKQLKRSDASVEARLVEEGRLRFYAGDVTRAHELTQQALAMDRNPETENLVRAMEVRKGPVWVPTVSYSEDSRTRENRLFDQSLTWPLSSSVRGIVTHRHAIYREENAETVRENAVGLGIKTQLGIFHTLVLQGAGHLLSGTADDAVSVSGRMNSRWTDSLSTTLEGGRSLYDTALALSRHITRTFANVYSELGTQDGWLLIGKGEFTHLSDENERRMAQGSLAHDLVRPLYLRGIYRFTYDHMRHMRPDYYSPQHLRQHQLGVEFTPDFKGVELYASYLPGWGEEAGGDRLFIEEVQGRMLFKLGRRTSLGPMVSFGRTPSYRRDLYSVVFVHWF